MPNWCLNSMVLKGKKENLERFMVECLNDKKDRINERAIIEHPYIDMEIEGEAYTLIEDSVIDANPYLTKYVEELSGIAKPDNMPEGYRVFNWYEWHNRHYGTKWGFCDVDVIDDYISDGELVINSSTAWCPPTELIHSLCYNFRLSANVESEECGMEIYRIADYTFDPESFRVIYSAKNYETELEFVRATGRDAETVVCKVCGKEDLYNNADAYEWEIDDDNENGICDDCLDSREAFDEAI